MRILVVGAGAIGGYFGGRLSDAGADVTFLVRARRAEQLARTGLVIRSKLGDVELPDPATVTADRLAAPFDLIILSSKAFGLEQAMADLAPAVGPDTAFLPLLNGMRHLDRLDHRFGAERVLGGLCATSTTLDADGRVLHLNEIHQLTFGERDGSDSERVRAIAETMAPAKFALRTSSRILQEMWQKWVFLATLAGSTCLMRAPVGDITAAGGGATVIEALFEECRAIAAGAGYPPQGKWLEQMRAMLLQPGSTFAASMMRDVEHGFETEADHVLGDLIARRPDLGGGFSVLGLAYTHLRAYAARRQRETPAAA
ncbi:MAG: 2-dehydropantoate 2-reductase [Azospirillum sp.]|nr:2-dehydropantoate 2-reductase [Azospirillum sp.]